MVIRLFLMAIAPAVSISIAMYMSDRYEREP
ncbi:MAG: PrsW family intramembrane metalloprotease, partial [Clostridiales bacterium]|nr:PrsW family intramembrane metalloprotease [Clostridiales bacterium]